MTNDIGRAARCRRSFKAPWLQTERTKNEKPSEKNSFNGEQFEIFNPKKPKIQSSFGQQNNRTTRPGRQKLNMNHVARKKLTEAKLKEAFRIKLFELCKTRSKKSSPGLFNFYVISARRDMANDAGGASTCKRSFKAPWLQTERTKNEGPSEKTSFNGEQFEVFKPKNQKIHSSHGDQTKGTTRPQGQKLNMNPCKQEEINGSEIEKIIQNKTVGTLQDNN